MQVFSAKKSTRGKRIKCSKCGKGIKPGQPYNFIFRRYSRRVRGEKVVRCQGCPFRPSDLTSSRMGEVYDAQQDASADFLAATSASDIAEAIRNVIIAAEQVRDGYEESRNNMPESLQDVGTGAEMQEKIDALESYIGDLESAESDIDGSECDDEADDWLADLVSQAESAVESLSI